MTSAKKARASSPTATGGRTLGGLGGSSPNLHATRPNPLEPIAAGEGSQSHGTLPPRIQFGATWAPGSTTTSATADGLVDDSVFESLLKDGTTESCMGGSRVYRGGFDNKCSDNGGWSAWATICSTAKTRARVELPNPAAMSVSASLPLGLRYRVGARRRDAVHRVTFR